MDQMRERKLQPKSVLALYLKLYCKRRTDSKHKMIEGIKSWITLNEIEKQQFCKKYKECQENYKIKLANCLQKAHPFMKKKENRSHSANNETKTEPDKELEWDTVTTLRNVETHHGNYDKTEDSLDMRYENNVVSNTVPDVEISCSNLQLQSESHIEERRDSVTEKNFEPSLPEPACPSVRTARDLFELLKSTTNRENSETWFSLSSVQKSRYRQAVLLLKAEYINKYKTYLESLPSRELFNHYNKYFK